MGSRSSQSPLFLDYRIRKLKRQIKRRQKELAKVQAWQRKRKAPTRATAG